MQQNMNPKVVVLFVCEGKNKTEKKYFNHFKARENKFNLKIEDSEDTNPIGLANNALRYIKKYDMHLDRGDKAFCLMDLDLSEKQLKEYLEVKSKAKYKGIEFIVSNPCFEVWFMFHFLKDPKKEKSSEDVKKALCGYIKNYEENLDVYEKYNLQDRLNEAYINASNKAKLLEDLSLIDKNPYTEVGKLIDLFNDLNK